MANFVMSEKLERLVLKLHEIDAIKFGNFMLKSGIESPVYFDLRVMISYPQVMTDVADIMLETLKESGCKFDSVCGVPYTALPIATVISIKHDIPMLIRRKEAKDYGTKKIIEGKYKVGEKCLVVEDVVTSGSSVQETVQSLNTEKIEVTDAVVLLDRDQGGKSALKNKNITLHSVCTLTQVLKILQSHGKLNKDIVSRTEEFIKENRFDANTGNGEQIKQQKNKVLTHRQKASMCTHPVAKRLYSIMDKKETNLAVSADVMDSKTLIKLVDKVGPYICVLKTHVDIIEDFTPDLTQQLKELADKHNFLIFEDRKFADIGNTVKMQYSSGVYKTSSWAHIINCHALPGEGIIKGLKEVGLPLSRGCLLLAQMSTEGSLAKGDYTKATVKMAEDNKDFIMGLICQSKLSNDPDLVHMTPGVKIGDRGDGLGQQYVTPEEAVCERGADVIIVGRGISQSSNPELAAKEYQTVGYSAYCKTLEAS